MKHQQKEGGLANGVTSVQKFDKNTTQKPTDTGRVSQRPTKSAGRGLKIKGCS